MKVEEAKTTHKHQKKAVQNIADQRDGYTETNIDSMKILLYSQQGTHFI